MEQLSIFPDSRPPRTVSWNLWHGCTKVSPGCMHCYMFRQDESVGRDPTIVRKTQAFTLPVSRFGSGPNKGQYRIPPGSHLYTCFSSDFFHIAADEWRPEAWAMIRERADCTFFMITKRPEQIPDHLPPITLPLRHRSVMVEPFLERVNLRPYLETHLVEAVSAGGESGPEARPCDFDWVLDLRAQCVDSGVNFFYHQTGARLIKDGRCYQIPRHLQHIQARKAGLDYNAPDLFSTIPGE